MNILGFFLGIFGFLSIQVPFSFFFLLLAEAQTVECNRFCESQIFHSSSSPSSVFFFLFSFIHFWWHIFNSIYQRLSVYTSIVHDKLVNISFYVDTLAFPFPKIIVHARDRWKVEIINLFSFGETFELISRVVKLGKLRELWEILLKLWISKAKTEFMVWKFMKMEIINFYN